MNGSSTNFNNNNPSGNPSGDIFSWIVVIICLVAFWPLGLFMLLKKISSTAKGRNSASVNPGFRYQQRPPVYHQKYGAGYAPKQPYYRPYAPQQQQQQGAQNNGQGQQGPAAGSPAQSGFAAGGAAKPGAGYQPYRYQSSAIHRPAGTPEAGQGGQQNTTDGVKADDDVKADSKKQLPAKNLAMALTVLAVIIGIMGVIFLSSGLSALAVAGVSAANLGMTIFGAFSILGAVISALLSGGVRRRVRKFSKYAAVIGDREIVSVAEISKTLGESLKKTRKSLQAMIDSGYFGESAYIDSELDSLVLSHDAVEKVRKSTAGESAGDTAASAAPGNEYVSIINELHMLCSQTSDPSICGKIERIEELTAKIFRIVEEKPEKLPQLRRFMNYYLPTTMKLLHSYQTLERQGIDGENISSAKQDIERILDTLAVGYEQQLDNLFMSDKLDISAEVNVLENLMEQDGLTSDGGIMKTAGGN